MADARDIEAYLREQALGPVDYRAPPLRRDTMPTMDFRVRDDRPSWRAPAPRPSDPTGADEGAAIQLGNQLAGKNWIDAIGTAAQLAMGAIPGAMRGGKGGTKGSAGPTGPATRPGSEAGGLPGRGGMGGGDRGLPPSGGSQHQYTAIPGQPSTFKLPGHAEPIEARPIRQIEAAARDYAHSRGRPYEVAAGFESWGPENIARSQRIARAYEAMKHDPTNPDVKRAYDALIDETIGQYKELRNKGLEYYFNRPGEDPYAKSPALGYEEMRREGSLSIFPTIEGHGSLSHGKITPEQVRNNPLLLDTGEMWRVGKQGSERAPVTANDMFRAVHDSFGHHGPGNPFFRGPGEDRAFGHHQVLYGPAAHPAMTSELRGQNSWLNYGDFPIASIGGKTAAEYNKGKSGADTLYAEQKVGIMPEWTWLEGLPTRKPGD